MTERITLVEIDVDRCTNRFGVSPCTAQIVATSYGSVTYYPEYAVLASAPFSTSGWIGTTPGTYSILYQLNASGQAAIMRITKASNSYILNTLGAPRAYFSGQEYQVSAILKSESGDQYFTFQLVQNTSETEIHKVVISVSAAGEAAVILNTGSATPVINLTELEDNTVLAEVTFKGGFIGFVLSRLYQSDAFGGHASIGTQSLVSGVFWYSFPAADAGAYASVVTGGALSERCFNSVATCQDRPNYAPEQVTVRHSTQTGKPNPSLEAVPCLVSIQERPARLALGESIGTRASITAAYKDCLFPDTGPEGDYYRDLRNYDPMTTGTYWGKFRARFPFLQGAQARVLQGTTDQLPAEMETRHFIVDTFAGPDSNGNVSLVLKDALKLADSQKAQAPVISIGALSANINNTATSITLTPIGAGDDYPSSGVIAIGGDEIATYSGRSGDTLTGLVRGQFNTAAIEHTAGARVQLCLQYTAQKVTAIIRDLLVNYARVPASYIPLTSWTEEDDTYIQRQYSSLIAEPTPVNELINELLEQTASAVWWDDSQKLMQFRVLKSVDDSAALYDDNVIRADSFSSADQNDKRVSQVWTYYGQINPLEPQDDPSNYSRSQVTISPESEQNFDGTPSIKRIYSRWITETGADAAQRLNLLILSRYTTPPRMITWALLRNQSLIVPQLGSGYRVSSWTIQEPTGRTATVPVQVVQVKTDATEHRVMAEEVLYSETVAPDDPNVKRIAVDSSRLNLNLYDTALASPFLPPQSGDTYIFTLAPGVVIGSSSVDTFAVDADARWPAGVTIRLVIPETAYVVGRGGAGGNADARITGSTLQPIAANGQDGGDALRALVPIEVDNTGIIGGGGGGGGGAAACTKTNVQSGSIVYFASGSGGNGGAGSQTGSTGIGTDALVSLTRPGRGTASDSQDGNTGTLTDGATSPALTVFLATSKGGSSGALGQSGSSGVASFTTSATTTGATATGTGGAPGAAVVGNANITWINTGTRLGPIT